MQYGRFSQDIFTYHLYITRQGNVLQFDKPIALAALFQLAVLKKINVSIAVENKDVRHFNKKYGNKINHPHTSSDETAAFE